MDYTPGNGTPLVPMHIPDPPGQQIVFKLVYVDPRAAVVKQRTIQGMVPVPGQVGAYVPVVLVGGETF